MEITSTVLFDSGGGLRGDLCVARSVLLSNTLAVLELQVPTQQKREKVRCAMQLHSYFNIESNMVLTNTEGGEGGCEV